MEMDPEKRSIVQGIGDNIEQLGKALTTECSMEDLVAARDQLIIQICVLTTMLQNHKGYNLRW